MKSDPFLMQFGSLIAEHRKQRGISQEELAHRSFLDRTYISGVERGVRNPSLIALGKLADGLGLPLSEMFVGLPAKC